MLGCLIVSWIVAFFASNIYYKQSLSTSGQTPYEELLELVSNVPRSVVLYIATDEHVDNKAHASSCDTAATPESIACVLRSIDEKQHPKPPLDRTIFQVFIVISFSILWFITFFTATKYKLWFESQVANDSVNFFRHGFLSVPPLVFKAFLIFLSLLPPITFALSMTEAYQPAVFVMAMVAIFVAAEHYGGLSETEQKLERDVDNLENRLDRLLNADGLSEWKKELYGDYRKAEERIDAVIRHFDIDTRWWKYQNNPWVEYVEDSVNNNDTLLSVLLSERCKASLCRSFRFLILLRALKIRRTTSASFWGWHGRSWYFLRFEGKD
jgi:hypothetical protein